MEDDLEHCDQSIRGLLSQAMSANVRDQNKRHSLRCRREALPSGELTGRHMLCTPEERLQVVRQLRAASIARVHGDVHSAARVQLNLCVLKDKALDLCLDGQLYGEDLLCYH